MMFYWIYDYPKWTMAILFAIVFVAVSIIGLILFRSLLAIWVHSEPRANDMLGLSLTSFAAIYGILLGLVAFGTYQNFSSVTDLVSREAACLASLYRDTSAFPEPYRSTLQRDIREYTRYTIDQGWPAQQRGTVPTGGTQRVTVFSDDLMKFNPDDRRGEVLLAETFRQFNELVELRRSRLAAVTSAIPAVLWWVLAIGSLVFMVIIWMFDMKIHMHMILTILLGSFFGIVIFLIASMDRPLRGEGSVGPDDLELVYQSLMKQN